MLQIKICGIRHPEEVEAVVQAGANILGFNFWPGTPRYIAPDAAALMIRRIPKPLWAVGVFVDEIPERVLEIAALTGVAGLQLHGHESPEYLDRLGAYMKIKAVKVGEDFQPEQLRPYRSATAFLLDGQVAGGLPGGMGRVFDWTQAEKAKAYGKIILAGGLNARNVGEAVRRVQPWGVDVCSGVEIEPGRKDLKLIGEFVRAAREAELALAQPDLKVSNSG